MFARKGDQIDFANTRPGDQLLLEPEISINVGRRVRVDLEHEYNKLEVDGGTLFTANISELRLVYQFNRRTFVRLVSQYLDLERDPTLYTRTVEAQTRDLLNELLFSYKINPRTVLFLGYSDRYINDPDEAEMLQGDPGRLLQSSRAIFMKLGYAWVL